MPLPPMPPGFRPLMGGPHGGPHGMPLPPNLPGMPPVSMRPPTVTTSSVPVSTVQAGPSIRPMDPSQPQQQQQPKPLFPSAAAVSMMIRPHKKKIVDRPIFFGGWGRGGGFYFNFNFFI